MRRLAPLLVVLVLAGCATGNESPVQRPVSTPSVQPVEGAALPTAQLLEQSGTLVGQADSLAIYLCANPGRPCNGASRDQYWAVVAGQALRLPAALKSIEKVALFTTLNGGDRVYLLQGGESPVYVARAREYYLLRFRGGEPELIRFAQPADRFPKAMTSEWALYSMGAPALQDGTTVATKHLNPASGKTTILLTWQIDWETGVGSLVALEEDTRDPNK